MPKTFLPLALAAALALPAAAMAAEPAMPPHITVSGEGEATAAPDLALISLSVVREAKTAREAMDADNDAMASVIAAMKAFGIAERDLQTAGIQISPRYNYTNKQDGSQNAELVAYQVTNTLSVRLRDVDKAGEVLDKAVTLGVNQGGNVAFSNDNPAATITEARKKAVADAYADAGQGLRRCRRRSPASRREFLRGAGHGDVRTQIGNGPPPKAFPASA